MSATRTSIIASAPDTKGSLSNPTRGSSNTHMPSYRYGMMRFILFIGWSRASLRQKQNQAFAGAAGFEEFGHGEFVGMETAVRERRAEFWATFRKNNVLADDDSIASEARSFIR